MVRRKLRNERQSLWQKHLPDGWVFRSKWALSNSNACGVNDVRRFRFFDGSTPIKSVKWFWPLLLYRFQWLFVTKLSQFAYLFSQNERKMILEHYIPFFGFFHPPLQNWFNFLSTFWRDVQFFKPAYDNDK